MSRFKLWPPGGVNQAVSARPDAVPVAWNRYASIVVTLGVVWLASSVGFARLGARNDLNLFLIYALLALGFYWIYGLSGQFSFAHAAFVAIGAYTSAWLSRQGWPIPVAIVGAVILTMVCAAVFLLVVRKASHFYFAIASLGLASIVIFVLQKWDAFTGGSDGQVNQIALLNRDGVALSSTEVTGVLLGLLALAYVVVVLVDLSPLRRDAIALKHQPDVARVCGVRDLATRVSLFVMGCGAAAIAGTMLAHTSGFLGPESFGTHLGIGIFLMMVVGGETYLTGPVIGAAFYVFFPRLLSEVGLAEYEHLVYGVTLVVLMIFMPRGILGGLDYLRRMVTSQVRTGALTSRVRTGAVAATKPVPSAEATSAGSANGARPATSGDRLVVRDLHVNFGGVRALDGVSFHLKPGEILGLVGPNGSGKSTLLNAINGLVPATGQVMLDGKQVKLGVPGWSRRLGVMRAFQTPQIYDDLSCLDNIAIADPDRRGTTALAAVFRPRYVRRREQGRFERARKALQTLGAAHLESRPVDALSYGERRWVELSRGLVAAAKVVLLDEPSAGLNDGETQRLAEVVRAIREHGASVVLVDHKVDFISQVSDRVIVLDFGKVIAEGPASDVFADARVIEAYTGMPAADSVAAVPNGAASVRESSTA